MAASLSNEYFTCRCGCCTTRQRADSCGLCGGGVGRSELLQRTPPRRVASQSSADDSRVLAELGGGRSAGSAQIIRVQEGEEVGPEATHHLIRSPPREIGQMKWRADWNFPRRLETRCVLCGSPGAAWWLLQGRSAVVFDAS